MAKLKQLVENDQNIYPIVHSDGVYFPDETILSDKVFANNSTVTIKKGNNTVGSFTTNSAEDVTINLPDDSGGVPDDCYSKDEADSTFVKKEQYDEDSETISAAFNDLNDRMLDASSDISSLQSEYESIMDGASNAINNVSLNGIEAIINNQKVAQLGFYVEEKGTGNVITGVSIDQTRPTVILAQKGNVDTASLEAKSNKVTSLSNSSTDTQYPSAKCVYDALAVKLGPEEEQVISAALNNLNERVSTAVNDLNADIQAKQDTLVSGTNVKTINNQSIIGPGNITIDGNLVIIDCGVLPESGDDVPSGTSNAVLEAYETNHKAVILRFVEDDVYKYDFLLSYVDLSAQTPICIFTNNVLGINIQLNYDNSVICSNIKSGGLITSNSHPSQPELGQIYYNTNDNTIYVYTNSN